MFLSQAKDERNYHIFYEMLAGLPSQQKQAFYLQEAETYYYLNQVKEIYLQLTNYPCSICICFIFTCPSLLSSGQGGDCGIKGKSDADDYLRLCAAMEILHFAPEDQLSIFRVLSSVLHLGNVYFQKHEVTSPVHLQYRYNTLASKIIQDRNNNIETSCNLLEGEKNHMISFSLLQNRLTARRWRPW